MKKEKLYTKQDAMQLTGLKERMLQNYRLGTSWKYKDKTTTFDPVINKTDIVVELINNRATILYKQSAIDKIVNHKKERAS